MVVIKQVPLVPKKVVLELYECPGCGEMVEDYDDCLSCDHKLLKRGVVQILQTLQAIVDHYVPKNKAAIIPRAVIDAHEILEDFDGENVPPGCPWFQVPWNV